MPATTSRSPSPVPAPPIAAAPGPRAATLLKLYSDAISHTQKTCSYDNFSACFPTPAKHASDSLQNLHSNFVDRLGDQCKVHFDTIIQERNVVPALNDLDRLIDEARRRKARAEEQANGGPVQAPTPPHTLPASALYLSHLTPSVEEHQATLGSRLQLAQNENADLLATVIKQRREIEELVSGLETVVADLDGSLAALPHDEMLALTDETVAMDEEMRIDG